MYTDENNLENNFEKIPGSQNAELTPEQKQKATEWENAMAGVPESSNEQVFGNAAKPEAVGANPKAAETGAETEISADFAGAARLNKFFKLDAISEYYGSDGIEKVIDGVATFDTSNATPSNIATQFYLHLGISSQEEYQRISEMDSAMKDESIGAERDSEDKITSMEGLLNDFNNTKDLIEQIKQADSDASEAIESSDGGFFRRIEVAARKKFGYGGVTGVLKYLTEKNNAKDKETKEEFEELEAEEKPEETKDEKPAEARIENPEEIEEKKPEEQPSLDEAENENGNIEQNVA